MLDFTRRCNVNGTLTNWGKLLILVVAVVIIGAIAGCSSGSSNAREASLAPLAPMPDYVQNAPVNVQEGYRFAAAHPDLLEKIPCYCGCQSIPHYNNFDCYVKKFNSDGSVAEYDNHAAYCTLCVDIARDVMRRWQEGQDLVAIRAYIDGEYSRFGPPTDTEPVKVSSR